MRALAIALVVLAFPLFCAWLNQGRKARLWAYALLGLLPFTINAWNLDAAIVDWAMWPGYAKGAVVTALDSLALAILATHRAARSHPLLGWLMFYLSAVVLSVAFSQTWMASAFYPLQLLRVIVLFLAVARIACDREALLWMAYGSAAGLAYQAGIAIWQKAGGVLQASGTMGHQNLLGMVTNFALLPLLALLLAGERSKLMKLGVVCALVVVGLGASRGTILFAGAGVALLFVLSITRRATPYKWKMVGFAAVALSLTGPVAYLNLEKRFEVQNTTSGAGEERAAFERAAKAIWSDHPFGVGANMYTIVANTKGYSQRAGVNWTTGSRSANVHNAYLLVAAETGWIGLAGFVALLAVGTAAGLRYAFADRRDPRGEVVLGHAVALTAVAAHNFYEWVIVMYQAQYMAAIALGVIAGMVRERRGMAETRRASRVKGGQSRAQASVSFTYREAIK